jgi:hypothetical protein
LNILILVLLVLVLAWLSTVGKEVDDDLNVGDYDELD